MDEDETSRELADRIAATIRAVDGNHTMGAGALGDAIAAAIEPLVAARELEVYEEELHRSSGWSMTVGALKAALRYVPDDYEVMLENADVEDCEIAELHIERMYPPDAEGPGLLVLAQGQVVSSEYGYHKRMDEDHELGTALHWIPRKKRWQSS